MSAEGEARATVPTAYSRDSNDLLGLDDTTSSYDGQTFEDSEPQNHNRNASGSSSLYFDALDDGDTSSGISNISEAAQELHLGLQESGAISKGKEASRTEPEGPQEDVNGRFVLAPQSLAEVGIEEERQRVPSTTARYDRGGSRIHRALTEESNTLLTQLPDTRSNIVLSGTSSRDSTPTRLPASMVPSIRAPATVEEDRRNWERIQAIAGPSTSPSTSTNNYVPEVQASSPKIAAQTPTRGTQKRKSTSSDNARVVDGTGSGAQGQWGNLRPPPYDESFLSVESRPRPARARQLSYQQPSQAVVVPRWQPDAEVTFCPICATQFSFFVRKHHCRKCGRVVCNACSPHRITIPYQFIVQSPIEIDTYNQPSSRARPALDPARAGSSSEFESLGGGERVRLCNPCVPDPNTAPPQTPQFSNSPHRIPSNAHSRSASSTNTYTSPQPNLSASNPSQSLAAYYLQNHRRHPREPSNLGRSNNSISSTNSQVYTTHDNGYANQSTSDPRTRSATVSGDGVRQDSNPSRSAVPGSLSTSRVHGILSSSGVPVSRGVVSHVPRVEHQIRPLPRAPRPRRIPEEDECPICHQELPSSKLPNAEALRAAHITSCIDNAIQGTASTPSPPPISSANIPSSSATPSSSTATPPPVPVPIANTPEARMAAREQAHAAIVLGQRSSPSPAFRPTGVFPYKATEKDCVDDAECTICLEEFEVGRDMGRLECFCRFHLHCIREWFVNHYGQCPVHHQSAY